MQGFEREMEGQRAQSRTVTAFTRIGDAYRSLSTAGFRPDFVGYDLLKAESQVVLLVLSDREAADAEAGSEVDVVTGCTPFYAESGGQAGDTGRIIGPRGEMEVTATLKDPTGIIIHKGRIRSGRLSKGDTVTLVVDAAAREATALNHTATHILHAALRSVLGDHVKQAGSLVAPDRLRFDFTHFSPVDPRDPRADRGPGQPAHPGQRAHPHRRDVGGRGLQDRRHGALRGKIRGPGPRDFARGIQQRALRGHPHRPDRQHRSFQDRLRIQCRRRGAPDRGRDGSGRRGGGAGRRPHAAGVRPAAEGKTRGADPAHRQGALGGQGPRTRDRAAQGAAVRRLGGGCRGRRADDRRGQRAREEGRGGFSGGACASCSTASRTSCGPA